MFSKEPFYKTYVEMVALFLQLQVPGLKEVDGNEIKHQTQYLKQNTMSLLRKVAFYSIITCQYHSRQQLITTFMNTN